MNRRYNRPERRHRSLSSVINEHCRCKGGKCECDECNEDEIVDEISVEEIEELTDCYKGRRCDESRKNEQLKRLSECVKENEALKALDEDYFDGAELEDELEDAYNDGNDFYDNEGNWDPVWKNGQCNVYEVNNIEWDTDGEDPSALGLPSFLTLTVILEEGEGEDSADAYVSEYLSDEYGFTHDGFDIKMIDSDDYEYQAGDMVAGVVVD